MAYRPKILVVESDRKTLQQLDLALSALGADLVSLNNSREAAQLINREKFDGFFIDWDAAGIRGEDLVRMVRRSKSNAKAPIAMITGRNDAKVVAEGFKLGVTFFYTKPLGPAEVARLLGAARGAMLAERRSYQRLPLNATVRCSWESTQAKGRCLNVSMRGLLVKMDERPQVGTRVSLEFALPPRRDKLSLEAEAVRIVEPDQVGLRFGRLSEEEQMRLQEYLERHGVRSS